MSTQLTQTMIAAENPAVRVGLVRAVAWTAAVDRLRDDVSPDDELHLDWEGAGLITPEGRVADDWARALRVTRDAVVGAEVVSVFDSVVFAATVLRLGEDLVCVTARATHDAEGRIDAVHPMLEVALGPAAEPWLLLRRVLPPLAGLRAAPRAAQPGEVEPLSLRGVEIPERWRGTPGDFARGLATLPQLPRAVADAVDPAASVFCFALRADGAHPSTSDRAWALGQRGLYRVEADTARVLKVSAGDVGHLLAEVLS